MKPWITLNSTELVNDRWLRVTADRCMLSDGKVIEPYYVVHENDWVHVLAQTPDSRFLVVRQFRYAAATLCVELPGGIIDKGETPLEAAQRELLEETGHSASDWRFIASMYANPARQTNSLHVFFARDAKLVAGQKLDHGEELSWELASSTDIERMIDNGEFSQSLHIASFYRCLAVVAREE